MEYFFSGEFIGIVLLIVIAAIVYSVVRGIK